MRLVKPPASPTNQLTPFQIRWQVRASPSAWPWLNRVILPPMVNDPAQPPLTLAVQMVSVGTSFIRCLAELDAIQQC